MATDPPRGGDPEGTRQRRPRREAVLTYRLHIALVDTAPPVWRKLEVSSAMFLDELHDVIQAAMGWEDYHLHRFTLGSSPWDRDAEHYLCPFDEAEGEDTGVPEHDVRLDEVLVEPGDEMVYTYDYGDDWQHVVRLEAVAQRPADAARAVCTDGRRAGPPEDCGGVWGFQELLTSGAIDAFAAFDPDVVNRAFAAGAELSRLRGTSGPAATLLRQLGSDPVAHSLAELISGAGLDEPVLLDAGDAAAATRRFAWLVHRVGGTGIKLTSAGYLPPVHVAAAVSELGLSNDYGMGNREVQTMSVLTLRESAQRLGLLRKNRGQLLATREAQKVRDDPTAMWRHIVARFPLKETDTSIEKQAAVVTLIAVAAGRDLNDKTFRQLRNDVLSALGWRMSDGSPLDEWSGSGAARDTTHLIEDMGGFPPAGRELSEKRPTRVGIAFARAVLQHRTVQGAG